MDLCQWSGVYTLETLCQKRYIKMKCSNVFNSKVLLGTFNFLFLACAFVLVIGGFLLFCDEERVLLSRLLAPPEPVPARPPLHYAALALIGGGLLVCATGALGCWATCSKSYCLLTLYFVLVLCVLLAQCVSCVMLVGWPACLGLGGARGGAVPALQASYGVSNHEQFTAAIDLAQTIFSCCGMTDGRNYDMSLWQLRRLGPRDLVVPLTCCLQDPADKSYLDPKPRNQSLCQDLLPDTYSSYRYTQGCLSKIEMWYQNHYIIFLALVLVMALCEFGVLLSTVLACTRIRKYRKRNTNSKSTDNRRNENIYRSSKMIDFEPPIVSKYIQPNNFYSPRTRNPRIFHTKHNDMA